jgi:hypothetical protein
MGSWQGNKQLSVSSRRFCGTCPCVFSPSLLPCPPPPPSHYLRALLSMLLKLAMFAEKAAPSFFRGALFSLSLFFFMCVCFVVLFSFSLHSSKPSALARRSCVFVYQ